MKMIKRTFLTAAVMAFAGVLCLFITGLVLAACSEKVTLRFETNGGTHLESVEGAIGTAYERPNDPEKEGYYFDGWYLTSDFSGERQDLPEEMPDESRTYYAKYERYPVLTLDVSGGSAVKTEHLIKPGTNLEKYLSAYIPEKQGLIFGGWYSGDELIDAEAVMTQENLLLKARYRAAYAMDVYLQDADRPNQFTRSEELSLSGADWEGETFSPQLPEPEHFYLDESRAAVRDRVLRAGENVLEFYFLREKATLTYHLDAPNGENRVETIESRYGALVTLPDSSISVDGFEFFGWSNSQGGPAEFSPHETLSMGGDTSLYSSWAKIYRAARGGGVLSVEEYAEEGQHRARFFSESGVRSEGSYAEETNAFSAGDYAGRLDGRGGFLPEDSGKYLGYALIKNDTDPENYGILTLDFFAEKAVYLKNGESVEGVYEYVYDEESGKYTGKYEFRAAQGEERFLFELDEAKGSFLREGEEKGEYRAFDGQNFLEFETLRLDGFGNAEWIVAGESVPGTYCGSGKTDDWQFEAEGNAFRFLLGARNWKLDGTDLGEEQGYLVYRSELAGTFSGSGKLTLDGYGYLGEYLSEKGEKITGRFERDGVFVTLYGESVLHFTLQGSSFARTGLEAGQYQGDAGELFLDGAGLGTIAGESGVLQGSYSLDGEECLFTPSRGASMRIRLSGGRYKVFDRALYGNYSGAYHSSLSLDGYGGGIYTMYDGRECQISVGYHSDELLEIFSPQMTLYFRIKSLSEISLIEAAEVGRYYLYRGGARSEDYLVLNGVGGARLIVNGETEYGEYLYRAGEREVKVTFDAGESVYLLSERDGVEICILYRGAGVYSGEGGTLTLDGYDGAIFTGGGETISGRYELYEGGVELYTEDGLYCFELSEGVIVERTQYARYSGPSGELYLEQGGSRALLKGETSETGEYSSDGAYEYRGKSVFAFQLKGGEYLFYRAEWAGTYSISDGGTLSLDGCGGGSYRRGNFTAAGSAEISEGLILFRSEQIASISKTMAFERLEDGRLQALGAEYGRYEQRDADLVLDGKGGATYSGVVGEYTLLDGMTEEYVFSGGGMRFRFRLLEKEGKSIFERYDENLASMAGEYETELGKVIITAYGAELLTENGLDWLEVEFSGANFLVATSEAGTIGCLLKDELEISSAEGRFLAY